MLFATGILALLATGLAVESLFVPRPDEDEEDDDMPAPDPAAGETLAPGDLLDEFAAALHGDADVPMPDAHEEEIDGFGEISVIENFQPGIDRLLLDLDPTQGVPEITFDTAIEPGSTAVLGDGMLMVMLRGTTGVSTADVSLQIVAPPGDWAGDGGTSSDQDAARADMAGVLSGSGDAITGSDGYDAIEGGDGSDAIFGNGGSDILMGGGGGDDISGNGGNDLAAGGLDDDLLAGGDGADSLYGGSGDDNIFGGDGDDALEGDMGNDFLQGGFGADRLSGGAGADTLDGTYDTGSLFAQDRDTGDTLLGGDGDDLLLVGGGDVAEGGAGADTVRAGFEGPAEVPLFRDFDREDDRIEILYDPAAVSDPRVTVEDFEDGSGATVLLNGKAILAVKGAQGIDPSEVVLIRRPVLAV
ncbi:hypothetical protein HKCCE2091_01470 [Rhodobacterales bacterium HKCCE2091]|nr:hypothetical protein [Rhodobacterales bacterium HKCCE2091]